MSLSFCFSDNECTVQACLVIINSSLSSPAVTAVSFYIFLDPGFSNKWCSFSEILAKTYTDTHWFLVPSPGKFGECKHAATTQRKHSRFPIHLHRLRTSHGDLQSAFLWMVEGWVSQRNISHETVVMCSDCESLVPSHLWLYNHPFTHIHPHLTHSTANENPKSNLKSFSSHTKSWIIRPPLNLKTS